MNKSKPPASDADRDLSTIVPRSGTTTAAAAAALTSSRREPAPLLYNPYEPDQRAPLQPEDFMSETRADGEPLTFRYDDFVSARRVFRRNLHGRSEDQFDPETLKPTKAYLRKIKERDFVRDVDIDPALEEERDAAAFDQPPEVIEQFRKDITNPRFRAALGKTVVRGRKAQVEAETSTSNTVPLPAPRIEITTLPESTSSNPDFFTKNQEYDGFSLHREREEQRRTAAEVLDRMLEDGDVPLGIDTPDKPADKKEAEDTGLTTAQAQKLLGVNPLAMLRLSARSELMQLQDVNSVYRLLYPILLQHEKHRQHYNIIELVRELTLCGAKYDGCIQMHTATALRSLVDPVFYKSFLRGGRLKGGHEHYGKDGTTRFAVFKFYLVHRNAENAKLLQLVDERGRSLAQQGHKVDDETNQPRLNSAGVYDIDDDDIADEDIDATDTYSSMHTIKDLHREFMLSLRVVCIECDDTQESDHTADNSESSRGADDDDSTASLTVEGGSVSLELDSTPNGVLDDGGEPETKMAREIGNCGPTEQLKINLEQATRLVGPHRADAFVQRVNSHTVGLLCVRSFMFYATSS